MNEMTSAVAVGAPTAVTPRRSAANVIFRIFDPPFAAAERLPGVRDRAPSIRAPWRSEPPMFRQIFLISMCSSLLNIARGLNTSNDFWVT
jgi:hypothetical protein